MVADRGRPLIEVEAKYRIDDATALIKALAEREVVWSEPVMQADQAYAPAGWSFGMSKIGVVFARLRTQDGHHLFTVKKPVDNAMSCLEHETVVGDRDAMHAALLTMGWAPTVRIVRVRRLFSDEFLHTHGTAHQYSKIRHRNDLVDAESALRRHCSRSTHSQRPPPSRIDGFTCRAHA